MVLPEHASGRVHRRNVLIGLLLVCLVSLPTLTGAQPRSAGPESLSVLFVGNSYTYFNHLAEIVSGIAASKVDGPAIDATSVVRGGATLRFHLEDGTALRELERGGWDFVVLQEQSLLGGTRGPDGEPRVADATAFHASVREWVGHIRAAGAAPLLYMTWARRSQPNMQEQLTEAYLSIGEELGVKVASVGEAWAESRWRLMTLPLHIYDGSHPSATGSYLTACVIYAALTGQDPRGASALIEGHPRPVPTDPRTPYVIRATELKRTPRVPLVDLRDATAAELQEIAWETVKRHKNP